jgi:hypothetical protein
LEKSAPPAPGSGISKLGEHAVNKKTKKIKENEMKEVAFID